MTWIRTSDDGVMLSIRVVPRSSKNEIKGTTEDCIKIKLTAPPVDGKANRSLIKFLAKTLRVSPSTVTIRAGESSRNKKVAIHGITETDARRLLHT